MRSALLIVGLACWLSNHAQTTGLTDVVPLVGCRYTKVERELLFQGWSKGPGGIACGEVGYQTYSFTKASEHLRCLVSEKREWNGGRVMVAKLELCAAMDSTALVDQLRAMEFRADGGRWMKDGVEGIVWQRGDTTFCQLRR